MPDVLHAALTGGVTIVAVALLSMALYLVTLTVAARFADRTGPPPGPGARRFAVLVPAHNEELLIGRLLRNLAEQDYPADRVDIHVVADNCTDETAPQARRLGADVHVRLDAARRGKGHALRWLLQEIRARSDGYDAYVILDADSVVARNFLRSMDARLEAGSQVVQAYYSVLNAGASSLSALRFAALAAIHYVRPLGRAALGFSCGLKGNGMCFAAQVLEQRSWNWFGLAEDVELHLALVRDGVRVDFAPETVVLSDMPVTFGQAASQNARWEQGRLELARRHVASLLVSGLTMKSAVRVDAAIEQLIPPLSVPFASGCVILGAAMLLGQPLQAILAGLGLAALTAHLLAGLAFVGAPTAAYLALGYAPVYVAWKAWIYLRALLGRHGSRWVRTARMAPESVAPTATDGA